MTNNVLSGITIDDTFTYYQLPKQQALTDDELFMYLDMYGDVSFNKLPTWIQQWLKQCNVEIQPRSPTTTEIEETELDHYEHRKYNNELTIDDHLDYFKGKRT